MNISDLRVSSEHNFMNVPCVYKNIGTEDEFKKIIHYEGRILVVGDGIYKFVNKKYVLQFIVTSNKSKNKIDELFSRHFFCLGCIGEGSLNTNEKRFTINLKFFQTVKNWGPLKVLIPEDKIEQIRSDLEIIKSTDKNAFFENIRQNFNENFSVTDGLYLYYAFSMGKGEKIDNLNIDTGDEKDNNKINSETTQGFQVNYSIDKSIEKESIKKNKNKQLTIYGKKYNINVLVKKDKKGVYLVLTKIYRPRNENNYKIPNINIMEFVIDNGLGGLIPTNQHEYISGTLREEILASKGYLSLWNEYARQEGEMLLSKVREIGQLEKILFLKNYSMSNKGICIPYSIDRNNEIDLLDIGDSLCFSKEIPIYLKNKNLTWEEYQEDKKLNFKDYKDYRHVKIIGKNKNCLILDSNVHLIPDNCIVSYSISGDEIQIRRREDARKRIEDSTSANPGLGLILEGKLSDEYSCSIKRSKIKPLSNFVREKIFKNPPTETQKRAIEIALNTPDIAIIQGPPGTGKTTVITAIIERLNELCKKDKRENGEVLITSFQHDAVLNVITRVNVNSLPTLKFGMKKDDEEYERAKEEIIKTWCEEYRNKLLNTHKELQENTEQLELEQLFTRYMLYPNTYNKIRLLEFMHKFNNTAEEIKRIDNLINLDLVRKDNEDSRLLNYIRKLRTNKISFLDDGKANAYDLVDILKNKGINEQITENKWIIDCLNNACRNYCEETSEQILADMKKVKSILLEKCTPKPNYKKDIPDSGIIELYKSLIERLEANKDGKIVILNELLRELKYNSFEVEKSLEKYLFVYAATTQQSEGEKIKIAKGRDKYGKHPEYDTVIVDEAARVSPADLLIPMSQAKKRIILVGDHRQLPHIYNEEIFENIKASGEKINVNDLKITMFEYLKIKADEMSDKDGIPRTIVLDAQYRMHPILGEFINNVFYEPYRESFSSPLPGEIYEQGVSVKPYPVEWYNLPYSYGKERKVGTSRIRECEANFIVQKLVEYKKSKSGANLSYGIISFYSQQVKYIREKLSVEFGEAAKEIRVGSVDAFQGMEFDVIFLSIVRSNPKQPCIRNSEHGVVPVNLELLTRYNVHDFIDENSEEQKEAFAEWNNYRELVGMQNYGFLTSENRLCVALSRQKKLLIVVGDGEIFSKGKWEEVSKICVPGLKKLYDLCQEKQVIYNGDN